MRILQAMAGAPFGGAEAFFERLVLALHRAGLEQHVLIRRNAKRAGMLRGHGVSVAELPFGGAFDIKTRLGFRHHLRRFKPDLALTWMNRATRFCPSGKFVHAARLGGYYDLKYYRRCDHLIGNTQDIVDYLLAKGWPAERAHYLPNFVAESKAPPASRQEHFTPANAPLILALGRLHENKAFDVLLQAVAKVPEVYLWLAGDGPLRGALEAQAERLGIKPRLRFLGWRDDTAALFAAADIFVCPSRHEPLGNVVIEAWAQGVPVVATASQGPAALITHRANGLLAPVDDVQGLAEAIRAMLHEPGLADELGAAGRRAYERDFTEAAVVARYLAFFEKVTG